MTGVDSNFTNNFSLTTAEFKQDKRANSEHFFSGLIYLSAQI